MSVLDMTLSILNAMADRDELSHDVLNQLAYRFNGRTANLGTYFSPRMRRADIEVPNRAVDVDSWAR